MHLNYVKMYIGNKGQPHNHKFVKKKYKWYTDTTFRGERNGVIQNAQLKPGKTARVEAHKKERNKQTKKNPKRTKNKGNKQEIVTNVVTIKPYIS